jgi:hypothetical protein
MSARAFQIVWSWAALVLLLLSVLGFLRSTGLDAGGAGSILEPFGILALKPPEVALFVLPVQVICLILLLALTSTWAKELGRKHWATRLPIFFFSESEVDPAHLGGQLYQRISLITFFLVPLLLTTLIVLSYLRATIYFSPEGPRSPYSTGINWFGHFNTFRIYASRGGSPGFWRLGTESGPQYYPLLTWLYACAFVFMLIYFFRTIIWRVLLSHHIGVPKLIRVTQKH